MNDYQRQRLYRAEQTVRRVGLIGKTFAFKSNVQAYVTALEDSAWFKAQYPDVKRRITVEVNSRTKAYARGGFGTITMPNDKTARWAWNEIVVLHEVAHNLTPGPAKLPCDDPRARSRHQQEMYWGTCSGEHLVSCSAHGPEFATIFLDLVYARMGRKVGDALKAAYVLNRVKSSHAAPEELPKPQRHVVAVGEIIQRRVAQETGVIVSVSRSEEKGWWNLRCSDHNHVYPMKGRLNAEAAAAHPSDWCSDCHAIVERFSR